MITIKEEFVGGRKWRRAIELGGADTILLWLAMKRYAAEELSNGFVPNDELDHLPGAPSSPRDALQALLECGKVKEDGTRGAGLVDPHPRGWQLHDYLDHANSAEQEAVRKEKARKRKADYRAGHRTGRPAGQGDGTDHGTSHGTDVSGPPGARGRAHKPNPTQPNPTGSETTTDEGAAERDSGGDEVSGVVVVGSQPQRIPCPSDLQLTEAQRQTLITSLIPAEVIDELRLSFVTNFQANESDTRTLDAWRKCLARDVVGAWNKRRRHGGTHGTGAGHQESPRAGDQLGKQLRRIENMEQQAGSEPSWKALP